MYDRLIKAYPKTRSSLGSYSQVSLNRGPPVNRGGLQIAVFQIGSKMRRGGVVLIGGVANLLFDPPYTKK